MLSSIPPGGASRGQLAGSAEGALRPDDQARRVDRPQGSADPGHAVRTEIARPVEGPDAPQPGDGTMRLRVPEPPPPDPHRLVGPRPAFEETPLERVRTERMQPPDPPDGAVASQEDANDFTKPETEKAPPSPGDAPVTRPAASGAYGEMRGLSQPPAPGRVDRTG